MGAPAGRRRACVGARLRAHSRRSPRPRRNCLRTILPWARPRSRVEGWAVFPLVVMAICCSFSLALQSSLLQTICVVKCWCGEIAALSFCADQTSYLRGVSKMTRSKACLGRIGITFSEVSAQAGGTTANEPAHPTNSCPRLQRQLSNVFTRSFSTELGGFAYESH